jgi:Probable cobalt transporter subunit (CbtB)
MQRSSIGWRISSGELPLWSWLTAALLLLLLFFLLSASGELLAPLLGQAAGVTNYLHEFAHDGRHLLGVPCH